MYKVTVLTLIFRGKSELSSKDQIVSELKRIAKNNRSSVSRRDFSRQTGISEGEVLKYFPSWNNLVLHCGLSTASNVKLTDGQLFSSLKDCFLRDGGITTQRRFRQISLHSHSVYSRRWGSWTETLVAFRGWLLVNDPGFPFLNSLPTDLEKPVKTKTATESTVTALHNIVPAGQVWIKAKGTEYGEFINFRGLQHAPINEQGVVFLFGMVARELGFVVENVRTGYPDCEAKRLIKPGNRWQKVRVEFEFKSRNFRDHGHDPRQCDLVVCWEHNWAECPLEVLELKSAIQEFRS